MADSADSPEDLAAESWLVASERISEYHGDADDFAGWLFGIARLRQANAYRRSARRQTLPTDDVASLDRGVYDAELLESSDALRTRLQKLSPRERDVIACIDGLDLSVETTAQALGMTRTAVRVARHRGLKRLRRDWPVEELPAVEPTLTTT